MNSFFFITVLFLNLQVSADAVFPLSSGRPQQDGNCWAYGASHMIEAKVQKRDGISVMTNIEKSYRYWLLYDRLLNSFQRKAFDEGDGGGEGINDIGAFAADFFHIYENHGFEWLKAVSADRNSEFAYPQNQTYRNRFQSNPNAEGLVKPELIKQAEKRLVKENLTQAQAIDLIQQTLRQAFAISDPLLNETPGYNSAVPVSQTFSALVGSVQSADSMILLSSVLSALPDGQWFRYDSERFKAISYHNKKFILKVVRASLDRGWPTTFETNDHVMTALGYQTVGDSYFYAISDSSGAYANRGISWVSEAEALRYFTDATVYFDVVADLLSKQPFMEELMPSVHLPRKR